MSRTSIPLTKVEALIRSSLIKPNIDYKLCYCLRKGGVYQGFSKIRFDTTDLIKSKPEGTFLEFAGHEIQYLSVNGTALDDLSSLYKDSRIWLNNKQLKLGSNEIIVGFQNNYNNDSFGLVSTTDVDGKQYVYIQTVPHYAHRLTPMFDQLDLKGTFEISVVLPQEWTSVTTGDLLTSSPVSEFFGNTGYSQDKDFYSSAISHFTSFGYLPVEDYFKVNTHKKTSLLATYLLNLVCGPFAKVELPEEERHEGIPMTIYCRESLYPYMKAESQNMFDFQKAGIQFYNSYFKYRYPYSRMDMLFCPEFAWGAMEYPGAVTYAEHLIAKEVNSDTLRNQRGSIIMHELAHMWFGNLVTMKWWDDLWLNEAFAEFICHLALQHSVKELKEKLDVVEHPW